MTNTTQPVPKDKLTDKIIAYLQSKGFRAFAMQDLESKECFIAAMGNGYIRLIEVSGTELGKETRLSKFDALSKEYRQDYYFLRAVVVDGSNWKEEIDRW